MSMLNVEHKFFSGTTTTRKRSPQNEVLAGLRGHLLTGLAVLFSLMGVAFAVMYFAFLKDNTVALWAVVGVMALVMFFMAWMFFKENGALLLGTLFGSSWG